MSIKKTFFSLLVAALCFGIFMPANAAVFQAEQNVGASEVVPGNLYLAGSNLAVNGNVEGDLMIAGGNLNIDGIIRDDLTAAGGNLSLTGNYGGDLRCFGGSIFIDGEVGGEVLSFGSSITIGPNADIKGSLVAGGDVVIVDPAAKIAGEQKIFVGEDKGEALSSEELKGFVLSAYLFGLLYILLAYLIVAAFLLGVFPNVVKKYIDMAAKDAMSFWKYLGLGFAFLIMVPIFGFVLFAVPGGALAAGLLFAIYLFMILLNLPASGLLFGTLMKKWIKKDKHADCDWAWGLGGVVVLLIICQIPVLGWLFGFVFFLYSMGASIMKDWDVFRNVR